MRRCIASSWFKSDVVNGMLIKPHKMVGVTNASNKRKRSLIEMQLFVNFVRSRVRVASILEGKDTGAVHGSHIAARPHVNVHMFCDNVR
jgi:hypothetical protein